MTDHQDKYAAESTTLRDKMRKELEKMEDLVETLCSAAQDVSEPVNGE
jgi:breast cancer 2 susceptibility protein